MAKLKERWAFSESELANPEKLNSGDELIGGVVSVLQGGDYGEEGEVIVYRNGTISNRYSDGTVGVTDEEKDQVNIDELYHPDAEQITDSWRDVYVDEFGNFLGFVDEKKANKKVGKGFMDMDLLDAFKGASYLYDSEQDIVWEIKDVEGEEIQNIIELKDLSEVLRKKVEEIKSQIKSQQVNIDELYHPDAEQITDSWRDVYVDEFGNFLGFVDEKKANKKVGKGFGDMDLIGKYKGWSYLYDSEQDVVWEVKDTPAEEIKNIVEINELNDELRKKVEEIKSQIKSQKESNLDKQTILRLASTGPNYCTKCGKKISKGMICKLCYADVEPGDNKEQVTEPKVTETKPEPTAEPKVDTDKSLEGKYITIIGKRWFDKINGNTYHSTRVYINNKEIGYVPFEYGYGDTYIQTAFDILKKEGYFASTDDYMKMVYDMRDNRERYLITVSDVARRKDL